MALFRKRTDPIEARSRELAEEIKRLEREIRDMGKRSDHAPLAARPGPAPSLAVPSPEAPRSSAGASARAQGNAGAGPRDPSIRARPPEPRPPKVHPSAVPADPLASPAGARKFDLPAAWRRWSARFTGKNPEGHRMAHYLAAGSFHGLRPLRYEKRIARNRFIGLFILLVIVLTGLARIYIVNLK